MELVSRQRTFTRSHPGSDSDGGRRQRLRGLQQDLALPRIQGRLSAFICIHLRFSVPVDLSLRSAPPQCQVCPTASAVRGRPKPRFPVVVAY